MSDGERRDSYRSWRKPARAPFRQHRSTPVQQAAHHTRPSTRRARHTREEAWMSTGPVRRGAALLAAALVSALLPAGPAVAAQPAPAPGPGNRGATTVTLVTGDQVTVTDLGHGRRTVTVQRPRGATGAVRTQQSDGRLTVVPDEALPYLRAGTLDRRLFDVSGLIRQGAHRREDRRAAADRDVRQGRAGRDPGRCRADPRAAQCARRRPVGRQGPHLLAVVHPHLGHRHGVARRAGDGRPGREQRPDRHGGGLGHGADRQGASPSPSSTPAPTSATPTWRAG